MRRPARASRGSSDLSAKVAAISGFRPVSSLRSGPKTQNLRSVFAWVCAPAGPAPAACGTLLAALVASVTDPALCENAALAKVIVELDTVDRTAFEEFLKLISGAEDVVCLEAENRCRRVFSQANHELRLCHDLRDVRGEPTGVYEAIPDSNELVEAAPLLTIEAGDEAVLRQSER